MEIFSKDRERREKLLDRRVRKIKAGEKESFAFRICEGGLSFEDGI